jgi:hypothetical protein
MSSAWRVEAGEYSVVLLRLVRSFPGIGEYHAQFGAAQGYLIGARFG